MHTTTPDKTKKPAFDPNQPYEPAEEKPAPKKDKPAFNPDQPYEPAEGDTTYKPADLVKLSKERKEIEGRVASMQKLRQSSTMGAGYVPQSGGEDYTKELATIDEQFKMQGVDPAVAKDLEDIPEGEGFSMRESVPNLLKLRDTNKFKYDRELGSIKSKGELFNAVRDKAGMKAAAEQIGNQQKLEKVDYREATRNAIAMTREFVDDGDEQNKIIKNIVADKAYDYGIQPVKDDQRFAHMNPYQQRAMQFLEDVDPATFQAYQTVLAQNPDEQWLGSRETDIKRGFDIKSRELENIGMGLEMKAYEERLTDLKNKGNLTPEEQQEYNKLVEDYQVLAKDREDQRTRYPAAAAMDAERLMQESMGANNSVAKKFMLGVGENFDDAINWVGDVISNEAAFGDLEKMGDKELTATAQTYTPEQDRLVGSDVVAKVDEGLQKKIDAVKNSKLSDEQKRDAIRKLYTENPDSVTYVANDKAGKTNFTAKAVMTAIGDVGKELVSQLAIAAMTGGGGNASKVRQLSSLFGSTFATTYDDYYNQALRDNNPNPSQYAITHTAIEAATELINDDFDVAKKMLGGKGTLGKILNNVSQAEWDAIKRKGAFSKIKDAAIQTGRTAAGNALQETKEEVAGQLAGNIADQQVFNQEVGIGDGVKDTIVQTLTGMLPLGLLSLPFNYKNINRTQKYAMYEAGMNPDKYIAAIDQDVKDGNITEREAAERRDGIKRASMAVKNIPAQRADGSVMTDNEKTDFALNEVVKQQALEQAKTMPEETAAKLKEIAKEADAANEKILNRKPKRPKKKTAEEPGAEAVRGGGEVPVSAELTGDELYERLEKMPQQDWEKLREVKDDDYYYTTTQMVDAYMEGNEKVRQVVDDYFNPKKDTDAIQKQSPDALPVQPAPGDGKTVGKGDEVKQPVNKKAAGKKKGKEVKLPTAREVLENEPDDIHEEHLDIAIEKLVGEDIEHYDPADVEGANRMAPELEQLMEEANVKPEQLKAIYRKPGGNVNKIKKMLRQQIQQAVPKIETEADLDAALQKVQKMAAPKKVKKKEGGAPLPMLTGEGAKKGGTPINQKVEDYTPASILEKGKSRFPTDEGIQRIADFLDPIIKANPNIKINYDAEVPSGVYAYSHSDGSVDMNWKRFEDEETLLRAGIHELVHAATRFEVENNQAFNDELADILSQARSKLGLPDTDIGMTARMNVLSARSELDLSEYGFANVHEMLAEVFTNEDFRKKLASIEYKGDSILKKIFLAIARLFSEKYRQLQGAKNKISADNLADYIMSLTENVVTGRQGAVKGEALPLAAQQSQEDAIKAIIKASPKSISDEKLLQRIVDATGLDEADVQNWIDEVRKPPAPPDTFVHNTEGYSDENKALIVKQVDQIFEGEPPKQPGWWKQQITNFKNGSAWLDNPYRFITKITQDIIKNYGLKSEEVIPLGRAFEKSAAGRAALRVDEFIQQVLNGKIGDQNYGRLKGKKFMDFNKYVAMKRVIDRHDTEQRKKEQGEDVSRATGNITKHKAEVRLEAMEKELGKEVMDEFAARADAFQHHMDAMLQRLVAAGVIGSEQYMQIKADNDFYAPFSVIQDKMLANQKEAPVAISGIVKRIKGIKPVLPKTVSEVAPFFDELADAVDRNEISNDEFFKVAHDILQGMKEFGLLTEEQYDKEISRLAHPGFHINNIMDAAANMIYRAEGMALKNTMMQRLYAFKAQDKDGLFIQDVEGFTLATIPDGSTRMVAKQLNSIPTEPGMAPVKFKLAGKDIIVAINKQAADKLNTMNNWEMSKWLTGVDVANKIFRALVITLSPGFQVVNFAIDFIRTSMLSRYGVLAGRSLQQSLLNAVLYMPQYIEAMFHSALGNVGIKTSVYKQWMESDSFSKGMFDNLFNNEKKIKSITSSQGKRILKNFVNLSWIEVPGSILEQTHKIVTHQRGMAVEGFKPEMFTAMMSNLFDQHLQDNMTQPEFSAAMDRLNYEVQNFAGSPNFPQTHKLMKIASFFLQFFSARVKGEMTDYRRVANLFAGKGEGVRLRAAERVQMLAQFSTIGAAIAYYAVLNNMDDDDEKEFDSIPSFHRDNYLNIPLGLFEFIDEKTPTEKTPYRDYAKIPLRGLTATMNVVANHFVKWWKRENPEDFKKMAGAFLGNASPINLQGDTGREYGESLFSNLTPVFKMLVEYSFNRDTHAHRQIIPDQNLDPSRSMLKAYEAGVFDADKGGLGPWDIATKKTPQWAKDLSRLLYETLDIQIPAITLDHMENTMGNPSEMYNKAIERRLLRSKNKYPVAGREGKVVEENEDEE